MKKLANSAIIALYMRQAHRDVPWALRPVGLVLWRSIWASISGLVIGIWIHCDLGSFRHH